MTARNNRDAYTQATPEQVEASTKDPGPWEGEQRNMWKPTQQ